MPATIRLYDAICGRLDRAGDALLPLLARFVFAATLMVHYWASALTKPGDGPLGWVTPSIGAYAQIFPRQTAAAGYDISQLGAFHWLVVTAGTWAEFILPALIVLGLGARLAALGMIGFVALQSLTDIYGHGLTDAATLGAWFDRAADSAILDQRLLWIFVLTVIVMKGAGIVSLDRLLQSRRRPSEVARQGG
jgi:putative oxidoreductase